MSALTPAEAAEVRRFGMFDFDILAEMEEHADDIVPCVRCDEEATHATICRGTGCTVRQTICTAHLATVRADCRKKLLTCHHCGFDAPGTGLDSMAKVVLL
ncbi:hypothetical protein [Microbacterium allomyrinae]|uniref:Uncharacterized protein n=1 Tax=Microbacterium allomyrinae TaxID=2830666 RepID=A0A9X1LWG7_9MICO|nr:hypothetical protein [Microbacterium allomyrinae]MCC2033091.1 hypothetical protein [Microbacterium allomyrinae]